MLPSTDTSHIPFPAILPEGLPTDSLWIWPGKAVYQLDGDFFKGPFLTKEGTSLSSPDPALPLKLQPVTASESWVFWILALSLFLVAIIRFSFPRRFYQLTAALASERSLVNMLREGDLFTERIMPGLLLVFSALMGLLLLVHGYQQELFPAILPFNALGWGILSLAVLAWWMMPPFPVWLLGFVFKTFDATSLYLSRILAMNLGFGLLLTLLLPLAWYTGLSWMTTGILWAAVVFNLYRVVRSISDGLRLTPFGLSYLLLFSFTLEVLPLLLLAGFLLHS